MGTTKVSNRSYASRSSGQVSFRILGVNEAETKRKKVVIIEEELPELEPIKYEKKKKEKKKDPLESQKVVEDVKGEIQRVLERLGGIKYYG